MGHQQSALELQEFVGALPAPPFDAIAKWPLCRVHAVISTVRQRPLGHLWSVTDLVEVAGLDQRDADVIARAFAPNLPTSSNSNDPWGADPLSLFGAIVVLSSLHRTTKLSYLFWLHDRRGCGSLSPPELVILMRSTLRGLETAIFPRSAGSMVPATSSFAPAIIAACAAAQHAESDRVDCVALLCICHRSAEITELFAGLDSGGVSIVEHMHAADLAGSDVAGLQEPPERVLCAVRAFDALALILDDGSAPSVSSKQLLVHPSVTQNQVAMERLNRAPASIGLVQFLDALFPDASPTDILQWWRWAQHERSKQDAELCFDDLVRTTDAPPVCSQTPPVRSQSAARRWSPLDSARRRPSRPPTAESPREAPPRPGGAARCPRRPMSASAGRCFVPTDTSQPMPRCPSGAPASGKCGGKVPQRPSRARSQDRHVARTPRGGDSVSQPSRNSVPTPRCGGLGTPRSSGGSLCSRPPRGPSSECGRKSPPIRC